MQPLGPVPQRPCHGDCSQMLSTSVARVRSLKRRRYAFRLNVRVEEEDKVGVRVVLEAGLAWPIDFLQERQLTTR